MFSQEKYLKALNFAAAAHGDQKTQKELPYVTFLASVAMEVKHACELGQVKEEDTDTAIQVALLHELLNKTEVSFDELLDTFGEAVAVGVEALSSDQRFETSKDQLQDTINRLLSQPYAIQMVKLAATITNLQEPPSSWDSSKILSYQKEAQFIFACLKNCSGYLSKRLEDKIGQYRIYIR